MGLDLRSDVFAHGQLYIALSRVNHLNEVMCLIQPSLVLSGVPHVANVICPLINLQYARLHLLRVPLRLRSFYRVRQTNNHYYYRLRRFCCSTTITPTTSASGSMDTLCRNGGGSGGFRALAQRFWPPRLTQDIAQTVSDNRAHPSFEMAVSADEKLEYLHTALCRFFSGTVVPAVGLLHR